jgi:hypothetical protein
MSALPNRRPDKMPPALPDGKVPVSRISGPPTDDGFVVDEFSVTDLQHQGIAWLLAGYSVTKAAEAIGVSRSTFYRWLRDSEFLALLRLRRLQFRLAGARKLDRLLDGAIQCLASPSDDPRLKSALRFIERLEILQRKTRQRSGGQ